MQPLTSEDLIPLEEFVARRAEFAEAHRRYCEQYRRVRVGPQALLLYENRQTLWFRVQEMLRVARLTDPQWVRRELAAINRLLPRQRHLQASLILSEPGPWRELKGDCVQMAIESLKIPAKLTTCRPADRAAGLAHWVEFEMPHPLRKAFANFTHEARIEIHCGGYQHSSGELSEEVRQSLLDDLAMSDRDAA
jgi:Protein of unknown function (DUF3501)